MPVLRSTNGGRAAWPDRLLRYDPNCHGSRAEWLDEALQFAAVNGYKRLKIAALMAHRNKHITVLPPEALEPQ